MTLYADKRVILRHAAPVVRHADKRDAAVLDFKSDLPGAGVNRVLKKLLYGRCRTLDDLACGYQVRNLRIKHINFSHQIITSAGAKASFLLYRARIYSIIIQPVFSAHRQNSVPRSESEG